MDVIVETAQQRAQYLFYQLVLSTKRQHSAVAAAAAADSAVLRLHHPPELGIVTFWVDDKNENDKN
jgi:hypothetical protein